MKVLKGFHRFFYWHGNQKFKLSSIRQSKIVKVQADNPYAFSGAIKFYFDCTVRTQKKSGSGGALEWTRDINRSGSVTVDINFIETIQGGVKKVAKVIGQDRWGTCGTAIVNKFNGMNG